MYSIHVIWNKVGGFGEENGRHYLSVFPTGRDFIERMKGPKVFKEVEVVKEWKSHYYHLGSQEMQQQRRWFTGDAQMLLASLCTSRLLLENRHACLPATAADSHTCLSAVILTKWKTCQLLDRILGNLLLRTPGLWCRGKHRGEKMVLSCPKQSGRTGIIPQGWYWRLCES